VEVIVARNGTEAAVRVRGDHIILRRVSAYDAGLRSNSAVMLVGWSSDVLLEDVIAAGTGRKNILIFTSERVTVRRAFTQWEAWDGQTADTCAMGWPAGNGINPYNSKYVIVENALVTGPMADAALRITANHESVYSPGMQVLGSIAAGAGMDAPGQPHAYPLVSDPACTVPSGGPPYYSSAWGTSPPTSTTPGRPPSPAPPPAPGAPSRSRRARPRSGLPPPPPPSVAAQT
jgi:hypothetical protein